MLDISDIDFDKDNRGEFYKFRIRYLQIFEDIINPGYEKLKDPITRHNYMSAISTCTFELFLNYIEMTNIDLDSEKILKSKEYIMSILEKRYDEILKTKEEYQLVTALTDREIKELVGDL